MNHRGMRAAVVTVIAAGLVAGCGSWSETHSSPAADTSTVGANPLHSTSVKTVDDLRAFLASRGLCRGTRTATADNAIRQYATGMKGKITKTIWCNPDTQQELWVTGFNSAADRDKVADEGFGDAYHYAGTGANLWVMRVHYDEGEPAIEQALGHDIKKLA